jgi:hypothetical protein
MLPFPIDVVGFIGCYAVLMLVYHAISQTNTHSFGVLLLSVAISYTFLFFLADYFLNVLILIVELFTNPTAFFPFFGTCLITGFMVKVYFSPPEKMNLAEMQNFIKASLSFENYFRLRDVDTQEKIGTHKMKKIYEEVHGKPYTEEVIATAFDEQMTTFKKVSIEELKEKKKQYPPEYFEEVARLNEKQTTDVSVSFRFQLMDNTFHSLLTMMDHFEINPVERILTVGIMYPVDKNISLQTQAEKIRLVERVYEALHILIAQEWFLLYMPFISIITVTCRQKEFSDIMIETVKSLMTFKISLHNLHLRSTRITTGPEIMKIAAINFLS